MDAGWSPEAFEVCGVREEKGSKGWLSGIVNAPIMTKNPPSPGLKFFGNLVDLSLPHTRLELVLKKNRRNRIPRA